MNLSNKTDDYYFLLKKIIGFWLFCLSTEPEDVSAIKFHSLVRIAGSSYLFYTIIVSFTLLGFS